MWHDQLKCYFTYFYPVRFRSSDRFVIIRLFSISRITQYAVILLLLFRSLEQSYTNKHP
jgi:hypothetical protein